MDNQDYNLDIYNSVGVAVYSNNHVYQGNDTETMKLDLSNFAKGVYYVRLYSKGEIKVKNLIIK
jgi:outer membrane scaffolding protein for murein synthesis (MipA/OmpV family)